MKQKATTRKATHSDGPDAPAEKVDYMRGSDEEEQHHRMTLEALADVDAGRLIDHASVQAWAASRLHP